MILDKEYNRSARWSKEKEAWDISDKARYRWMYPDGLTEASPWFDEIEDALEWIKAYDKAFRPGNSTGNKII